jgi:hypothetical protein
VDAESWREHATCAVAALPLVSAARRTDMSAAGIGEKFTAPFAVRE